MVAGEIRIDERFTAVETEVSVPAEQRLIGERRDHMALGHDPAIAGNDAVDGNFRLTAVNSAMAAAKSKQFVAEGPDHQLARVEAHGILPGQPLDRLAGHIQPQHSRYSFELCQRCGH